MKCQSKAERLIIFCPFHSLRVWRMIFVFLYLSHLY